jgi:sulfite exporter TauE/SafE
LIQGFQSGLILWLYKEGLLFKEGIHYLIFSLSTHTHLAIIFWRKRKAKESSQARRRRVSQARFGTIEVFDLFKGVIASFISFLLLLPIFVMDLSMRE